MQLIKMLKRLLKWWRNFKCKNGLHNYIEKYNPDQDGWIHHKCKYCNHMFKD